MRTLEHGETDRAGCDVQPTFLKTAHGLPYRAAMPVMGQSLLSRHWSKILHQLPAEAGRAGGRRYLPRRITLRRDEQGVWIDGAPVKLNGSLLHGSARLIW
jgi:hypothetical protein